MDECPTDPSKTSAGYCGCFVQEVDSDGDNVSDCADLCPTSSIKSKPGQCGCTVPDTDTDHDGIANCNDVCPNNPTKFNSSGIILYR